MSEPINDQQEANEVFNFLVTTTSETLGIDREQAEKRVTALFSSDILTNGDPMSPETQQKIEEFLKIPVE
jgi:hypothetical protein